MLTAADRDRLIKAYGPDYLEWVEQIDRLKARAPRIDGPRRCECTETLCHCEKYMKPKAGIDSAITRQQQNRVGPKRARQDAIVRRRNAWQRNDAYMSQEELSQTRSASAGVELDLSGKPSLKDARAESKKRKAEQWRGPLTGPHTANA